MWPAETPLLLALYWDVMRKCVGFRFEVHVLGMPLRCAYWGRLS